jgi:hypothetical protein
VFVTNWCFAVLCLWPIGVMLNCVCDHLEFWCIVLVTNWCFIVLCWWPIGVLLYCVGDQLVFLRNVLCSEGWNI